ncbi:MAG: (Fe-S)-binding protein [Dehalococcoidia bacterium]
MMADRNVRRPIPAGLAYIADNINAGDNILGLHKANKSRWAEGIDFSQDRSTVFFAGCGYQYSAMLEPLVAALIQADRVSNDPDLPIKLGGMSKKLGVDAARLFSKVASRDGSGDSSVLRDAVRVLKAVGLEIDYLGEEEPCCGAPLYHIGLQKEFKVNAGKAYERLKCAGVRKIIGMVPSCTYALRNLFPRVTPGFDIEVKHFIEAVADNMGNAKFRYPRGVKVVYHDPCQLGRYMGLIEQPRTVLRAVENVELVEPEWTSGEWSTCCGGGGGFEVVFPDMSRTLAINRAAELAETGADVIATQCPGCLMQLKAGLKDLKKDAIEIIDLASLLARALP